MSDGYTAVALLPTTIAMVAYPHMSHRKEFAPLLQVRGLQVVWVHSAAHLTDAQWVILPGSSDTAADLAWMRRQGLDAAITAHAQVGRAVLGIGGGLHMLGEALIDLHAVQGNAPGLGLLPLVTLLSPHTTQQRVQVTLPAMQGAWAALGGEVVQVEEIYQGQTQLRADMQAESRFQAHEWLPGMVWQSGQGHILGCNWHGLFENASVVHTLWGSA